MAMIRLKLPVESVMHAFNTRTPREKLMIVILGGSLILSLDYLILMRPVLRFFFDRMPQLAASRQEFRTLEEDWKNQAGIEKTWEDIRTRLADTSQNFVEKDQVPAFLENLSRLAQETNVKIISLSPTEVPKAAEKGPYVRVPISLSAQAGTHAFGRFLAKLESQKTFIRVTELKIVANPVDFKRHQIELRMEAYRKGA